MSLEEFLDKVTELANGFEIRKELEKGLKIQLTVDKERIKVVALRPMARRSSENTEGVI